MPSFGSSAYGRHARTCGRSLHEPLTGSAHRDSRLAFRRFVAPLIVVLALLFPAGVTGTEVAITIDDLPTHGPLPPGITRLAVAEQIIEVLRRHGILGAVGFVNGGQIADTPEHGIILEHWIAAGYRLGNHTFGHVDLDRTGPDGFLADIERNEPVIVRYGGTGPDRMFRFPYLHEGTTLIERRHRTARHSGSGDTRSCR